MASRYEETRAEIDDNTERVRTLVSEGNNDAAEALTSETEQLIQGLPKNQQKRYREALKEAGTPPPEVHTPVPLTPTPWDQIPEARTHVEATAKHMADGVRHQMKGAVHARNMAQSALQVRLRIPNPAGLPDLLCTSQEGRNAQSAMYRRASEQVEGDREEIEAALELLAHSVRNQMQNVLPEYVRGLDEKPDEARRFFATALDAHPDLSPAEAVYRHYETQGYELSRYTDLEKRRMKRELKAAQKDGDEGKALEISEALGVPTSDPEQTLSTSFEKLQRNLKKVEKALPEAIEDLSDDKRKAVRSAAEDIVDRAKDIVQKTL